MRFPLPPAVAPVFFILGALAVVWAALAFRSQRRFLSKALRATGVVQSLKAERMKQSTVYYPVIRFTTAAGVTIVATSKTGKGSGYAIGQPMAVLYDPANPGDVEIDTFWSRWLMVIAAAFVALVLFFVGATTLLSR